MDPRIIAENVSTIFSLPEVAVRVNELINSDESTSAEIEEIITHDPGLTAKILKLANSPYFGFPKKIDSISKAVSLIGHKELRNLVIATSVTSMFKDIPDDLVDMEAFWYYSVTSGVMSRQFAVHTQRKEQERFFIAGLLQGIGKLIYFNQYPVESRKILSVKEQGEEAIRKAELDTFGFAHTQLSVALLKQWGLPENVWKMIEYQFDPLNSKAPVIDSCILHVATNIANCLEPCAKQTASLDQFKPTYNIEAWNQLGIKPDAIQTITGETGLHVIEILNIIKPEAVIIF